MGIKSTLIFFFLFSFSAFATVKTYHLKSGVIKLDVPEKWMDEEKLLNSEITLVGPMKQTNRPVVVINSTEAAGLKFDAESLKKNQSEYEEGRQEWIKKYKGTIIKFYPYETKKIGKLETHTIGFNYSINETDFVSRSYYFTCGKNLYHAKTLTLLKEESENEAHFNKILNSFSCL